MELLRRGWEVHAVDVEASGLEMLIESVPTDLRAKVHTHAKRFEDFAFPPCDLVWSGYSLPFCPRKHWPSFWLRALAALNVGGRIAGDIFGPEHAFASEADVLVFSEAQAREALGSLMVEAFDIENGYRPSGGAITRWHAFGFVARKPPLQSPA